MNSKLLKTLCPLILLLVAGSNALHAQMSGNYTIDNTASASLTNFQNWYSFWRSLQGQSRSDGGFPFVGGITGSIVVTVKTDLTETNQVSFPTVSGTSSTKTITINGGGKYVAYSGSNEVISFTGGDYITINNLIVRHTGTSASAAIGIRFSNNSDNNTIYGCTMEFSGLSSGSTDGSAFVAFASSTGTLTTVGSTNTGINNIIRKNICKTTNSNSPGPSFGMVLNGNNSTYKSTAQNNTIDSNTIQNFYLTAIHTTYGNGNQINANDISRANATSTNCYSSLYGLYIANNFSSSRSITYSSNYIHDLPYSGGVASKGVSLFYGMYGMNNFGTSTYNLKITNNSYKNIYVYDDPKMAYLRNSEFLQVKGNSLDKMLTYTNISVMNLWDLVTGDEFSFSNNSIQNCDFQAQESYLLVADSFTASATDWCLIGDNLVRNNTFYYNVYSLGTINGNWKFIGNKVLNNSITGGVGGYFFGLMPQEFESAEIYNNLIAGNICADGFIGVYAASFNPSSSVFELRQNTIYSDGAKSSGKSDNNAVLLFPYYCTDIRIAGNVIYLANANSGTVMGLDCTSSSVVKEMNYNTYFTDNISSENWFVPGGNSASDFSGWIGLGLAGSGENYLDPKFTDPSNDNYKPKKFQLQNNVLSSTNNTVDIDKNARNPVYSDRGAYEQKMDIKLLSTDFTIGSSVCSGTYTSKFSAIVKNLFTDTIYNFNVSFAIDNGAKTTVQVKKKILPNDTAKVYFQPVQLNKWSNNARIKIFVDAADDDASNDSLIYSTIIKPAPGGSKFSSPGKPTKAIFRNGNPFDVTFVGEPLYIDFTPPRNFANSNYGTKWSASTWAITKGGNIRPVSETTLTSPSGGNDGEVKYLTQDKNMEDTIVKVCIRFTDLTNGCDTVNCTNVLVNPKINVDFKYPSIVCGKDTAQFSNTSSVKSGGMRFHWDFGTGNSADTSSDMDPYFIYTTPGTYKVKLTAYTMPWGYPTYDSAYVTVATKPTAKFTRTNACETHPLTFTNQTTPSSGTTYTWDFGDGQTSAATNPTHTYSAQGLYTVKLTATYSGCKDTFVLKALQYEKPKADFSKSSGLCDNETIAFKNNSVINSGTGILSSYWYFGDGGTANTGDASHKYTSGATYNVKLVVKSEFGCMDSITKGIQVRQAPKVSFTNSQVCANSPTQFINNTPTVSGATANYKWSLGDGSNPTAKDPLHTYTSLGNKTVVLRVFLDNGCSDSATKIVTVQVKPKADFSAPAATCSGNKVNFQNTTTWASGTINYGWDLGDSTNSSQSDPQHVYDVKKNTTFYVYLIATIQGGCSDTAVKTVTINALPNTCDFDAQTDYAFGFRGMKFEPKNGATGTVGGENGVTYAWNFGTGDSAKSSGTSAAVQYNYSNDGTFTVNMIAKVTASGCYCTKTIQIKMDRLSTKSIGLVNVQLFPNPSMGEFVLRADKAFGSQIQVKITSISGALIRDLQFQNTGDMAINIGDVADGIYQVTAQSGDNMVTTRMEIRR